MLGRGEGRERGGDGGFVDAAATPGRGRKEGAPHLPACVSVAYRITEAGNDAGKGN